MLARILKIVFIRILKIFNIYLFLRERETNSISRGGAEREGDTGRHREPESEADSRPGAVRARWGLELTYHEIMT